MIRHHNNFDFLRFVAATLVWYGHCYALRNLAEPFDCSRTGVAVFFVISGYFITASYKRCGSLLPFLKNRLLRILPALIVVVTLSVCVLGPVTTTLPIRAYFSQSYTWSYLSSMLALHIQYDLPGVFLDHTLHAVNGSLWTLPHEARCYGFIALLGVFSLLRPRIVITLLVLLWIARLVFITGSIWYPQDAFLDHWYWGNILLALHLITLFFCGSALYLWRGYMRHYMIFIVSLALLAISIYAPVQSYHVLFFDAGLAAIIIVMGFAPLPLFSQVGRYGDFSYGMYLYAFPMQQLSLHILGKNC